MFCGLSTFFCAKEKIPGFSTPKLSLNGLCVTARVVDVHDGDTVTLVIGCFGKYYKFASRINGIDTCELKGANSALAQAAKARMFELLTGTKILSLDGRIKDFLEHNYTTATVKCFGFDKYGRLLVHVVSKGNIDVAQALVHERLANVYNGGKKMTST